MKYKCVDCSSTEIVEDKHHREIYCRKCGRVLSSAPPYYTITGKHIDYPYGIILG
ncbi:MAG: TFIIB-type zinc ribbon-containing protein [Methanobrevibacter sp.]|nr:TFIIB-type zinc ribbon-containing protein [Methanobrevibacter sp.]